LVLAGAGANGGDGLHAAAMLREAGLTADAITAADRCHEEGAAALTAAGGTLHPLAALEPAQLTELVSGSALVLDALLGIGGRPEVPAALTPLLDEVWQS